MGWIDYVLTVIVQVTVISTLSLLLATLQHKSPARRHTFGVLGLLLILGSPIFAGLLPSMQWWRLATSTASPAVALQKALPRRSGDAHDPRNDPPRITSLPAINPAPPELEKRSAAADLDVTVAPRTAAEEVSESAADTGSWTQHLAWLLGCLWLTGFILSVVFWLRQKLRLRWLTRTLFPTENLADVSTLNDTFPAIAQSVCDAVGLPKLPPIAISDLPMPFVYGVWRPMILLPRELLSPGSESQLRDVLIHEAAHVARYDAWMSVAQRWATAVWWWHPGVLGLNRLISRSREEVCDNFVLRRGDAVRYAQTLVELAEKCADWGRGVPTLGILGFRWTLEARIHGLLQPERETMTNTKRRFIVTMLLLLGSVCWLIGGVKADPATAPDQTGVKETPQLHKVTVRGRCLDERNNPLADARIYVVRRSPDFLSHVVAGETRTNAEGRFELANVETAMPQRGDLTAAAALDGYVSTSSFLGVPTNGVLEKELKLSSNPGTLSGVVKDPDGTPIPGVVVFISPTGGQPLLDIFCDVTDADGRYAIKDLKRWTPESTRTFDPKTGIGTMQASFRFQLKHPDYPDSMAECTAVPQVVDVTLYPPAIVEGQVVDSVTDQPAADVPILAQGVGREGTFETTTDAQGRYRLRMTADHYNIWAYADDRIAVAVKAIEAIAGRTTSNADISLVRGGFVTGTVFDVNGQPVKPTGESPLQIAHYGPARPQTGAAVTSTPVQSDGTYRLRVAPGKNFVYCMSGEGTADYINVNDGQEVVFDIHLGAARTHYPENADQRLARQLRSAADQRLPRSLGNLLKLPDPKAVAKSKAVGTTRNRPDTPIGKLLDELEQQNSGPDRFEDVWAKTLQAIVELGPEATPELIAELDATENGMMLSCLGFTMRAINDKRAVPALIRAIPKLLRPAGSDMGLRAKDEKLALFMREHDLDKQYRRGSDDYGFGRPVREIFGALNQLTGQSFGEVEIYSVFDGGTNHQVQLKRQLFHSIAQKWATWWELEGKKMVDDPAYAHVGLAELVETPIVVKPTTHRSKNSGGGTSGWILSSYTDPQASVSFYDLDTGRAAKLPKQWQMAEDVTADRDEIIAWASEEGFELMGTEYQSPADNKTHYAILPIGMEVWELGRNRWKKNLVNISWETLKNEATETKGLLLHFDQKQGELVPEEHAPFLFRTQEGTFGVLNVGVEVHDTNVELGKPSRGDTDINPVGFFKGRRFGWTPLKSISQTDSSQDANE